MMLSGQLKPSPRNPTGRNRVKFTEHDNNKPQHEIVPGWNSVLVEGEVNSESTSNDSGRAEPASRGEPNHNDTLTKYQWVRNEGVVVLKQT